MNICARKTLPILRSSRPILNNKYHFAQLGRMKLTNKTFTRQLPFGNYGQFRNFSSSTEKEINLEEPS